MTSNQRSWRRRWMAGLRRSVSYTATITAAIAVLAACGGTAAPGSSASSTASSKSSASASPAAPSSSAAAESASAQPASAAPSAKVTEFKYGISTVTAEVVPVWIARDKGFDRKNGIQLSVTSVEGGSKGLEILLGGGLQAMQVGLSPVVVANTRGAQFRSIMSAGNVIPWQIMGGKGITPENAKEKLKGSKVGISTFSSESDMAVGLFLDHMGMVRDKDVAVVQVGGAATRLSALLSGAISAAPLDMSQVITAEAQGLKPLLDLTKGIDWVFDTTVMNKPYLDAHRDLALGLLRAVAEGNYYARANPDEAKKTIAKEFKYTDQKLIDAVYQEFMTVTPVGLKPTDAGIKEVLKQVASIQKIQPKSQNAADYVDLSLVDKLQSSGFLGQLQKQYNVH